ncbi:bone marrow proteoglycan-like isoform X2 [Canis lupus familiaris]|uniref:bone marrow proteoglycan isoform X2 n=1 Tax=Canis lupus dingo TaxID=286419 RepID=UPI000DC6A44E|nr:bone marrow proteoglycan isoform X2 [Canis lupus dingo]XP_038280237.1 bone marrow proteoglycan-like isoform X2 [Canis lupus familiaris]XP_038310090.1 bone marrow proteoglycan-like isoform X2 [Canis lupus familiaris]XP_038419171.1 bone marrow proteoglycan-like isoform X2 [Canis lupus familiaris]
MKVPLLLALLFGVVSTLHLREMTLLEEKEEGYSGTEDDPEEEGAVECDSALDKEEEDFQCPKEEDIVRLEGSPGCKNCPRFLLVRHFKKFNKAQRVCRRCYRGNLASIHSAGSNCQIQNTVRCLNQGQVWIGGTVRGWGPFRHFSWVDGSGWNYATWAAGQPAFYSGRCVSFCTKGGRWRINRCGRRLPFICAY